MNTAVWYQKVGLPINYYSYYFTCPTKHHHPSLITLRSVCDDPSGGRRPTQIPQLDTPQASKESRNSIHNRCMSVSIASNQSTVSKTMRDFNFR